MSQRPSSRKSAIQHQSTNRKNQIQDGCDDCNNESQIDEDSRYDPKDLRDLVRILSPFVRLILDTNNPYARLVAQEVRKTFYHLFYPDMHPSDVAKTLNLKTKCQKYLQLWNECWLYIPESPNKKWVSMRTLLDENIVELYNSCSENYVNQQSGLQQRTPNCNTNEIRTQTEQSSEFNVASFSEICPNLFDMSPPDCMCEHQFAGSDLLPCINNSKSEVEKTIYLSSQNIDDEIKYIPKIDSKLISNEISESERLLTEALSINSLNRFRDTNGKIKLRESILDDNCFKRQSAGNGVYLPYCEPGCSRDSVRPIFTQGNMGQYEYYRITGNTPSPRLGNLRFRSLPRTPVEPELRTNALRDCDTDTMSYEESDESGSVVSVKSFNPLKCNSSIVANAFNNLSLEVQKLKKKKNAFTVLTKNYLKFMSNSFEEDNLCMDSSISKIVLQSINENPPTNCKQFDDDEWNDNAFRDKDFINLLPFYELVHNQLECISKTQQDYCINMLDDIMSTFFHIHYDLGDPRLKNDMLVEHVKLITRNTWELYFYKKNKKMPTIPEKSYCPLSPQGVPPQVSLKPSNLRPSNLEDPGPRSPNPIKPPSIKQFGPNKNLKSNSSTTINKKSRVTDAPQQCVANPPIEKKSK
jgi:hypothetical protein